MTEPTSYDLIQDTRLDALEGVLADVTVPGTGEVSFPVAQQGMDTTMWQQLFRGFGTGVLDLGSYPYRLTSSDTPGSGTITIHPEGKGPAQAVIEGFFHRLPAAKTLTVPAVSVTTTFTVALQYDPTQHKRPSGPILLGLFTGQLDRTQGKKYVVLWEGVRQPSTVVSQMTWVQKRHRVVPTIHVASQEYLPDPNSDGLLWGTRAFAGTGAGAVEYQLIGTTGSLRWESLAAPPWQDINLHGPWAAQGAPPVPQYRIVGNRIYFRGLVRKIGTTLPTSTETWGWITGLSMGYRYLPSVGNNAGSVRVEAAAGSGGGATDSLRVQAGQSGMSWFSLDGLSFDLP